MPDYLVRTTTTDGQVRALACVTTGLVDEARRRHGTLPTATAALGRTLTGAALIGSTLKREDIVTVQVMGDGPVCPIVVDADAKGNVRGYVKDPLVHFPPNAAGKLDVSRAVGTQGHLYVIKDLGLKEPYRGSVPLVSGELAQDFTYYFSRSEQTPSACALGVLVGEDNSVLAAGGYLLQLMPGADRKLAEELEAAVAAFGPVTSAIARGDNPEQILATILGQERLGEIDRLPLAYKCRCNRSRLERVLLSMGKDELTSMLAEQGGAELICHFCRDKYEFTANDLSELISAAEVAARGCEDCGPASH